MLHLPHLHFHHLHPLYLHLLRNLDHLHNLRRSKSVWYLNLSHPNKPLPRHLHPKAPLPITGRPTPLIKPPFVRLDHA